MFYSQQQIDELTRECAAIAQKYQNLLFAFHDRQYQTERGREFGMHGFMRRLGTLRHCIERVFLILPPGSVDIPSNEAREDATIAIQAFIFNVFGCLDNLASIWVEEKAIRKADGTRLAQGAIGFGEKYPRVRQSFSDTFRAYLVSRADWFAYLGDFRHALAHRVPLYIPPHAVSPENQVAYQALEHQIVAAVLSGSEVLEGQLRKQQRQLMFFRPWIVHSFGEQAPMVVIHAQMLADFNTVDEIARNMLHELQ